MRHLPSSRSGGCTTASCFTVRLKKKSLADPEPLIGQVRELCQARKYDAAVSVCQSPSYWHKALAQLIAVALQNRDKGLAKIKQLLVTEFHTEVIAGMENRLATISTIVRMGPLLGLLGTVASMIGAFSQIGSSEQVNPRTLANQISLALWATGAGLLIANPMMLIGNDVHARLRRLRDRTERQLQEVLEVLEPLEDASAGAAPTRRSRRGDLASGHDPAMTSDSGTVSPRDRRPAGHDLSSGHEVHEPTCCSAAKPPRNATSIST